MRYPGEIQVALLFDRPVAVLDAAVRSFRQIEMARSGTELAVPESTPNVLTRLYGPGEELMITVEYLDRAADPAVFAQTLASAYTGLVAPDARTQLLRSRSHMLINVSHGVLGTDPQVTAMLQQIDYPIVGQSYASFCRRLELCALLARLVGDEAQPSLVHWCQSNVLLPGDKFDALAAGAPPGPLHVHPFLFGDAEAGKVGFRTFGARHFIEREVIVEPTTLPWAECFETVFALLRVATAPNGYLIPDGDSFGPEDRSASWRVTHRAAEPGDVPLIELRPLMVEAHGFVADDYVPRERAFDDRAPPPQIMPAAVEQRDALSAEWEAKRALAEGIGGRFEVRSPKAPPQPFGGRPVFGRKRG